MLGYVYPLLDIFFTMLWFFAFVFWLYVLVIVITDIFRSRDLRGVSKAAWFLCVLVLPLLGVLIYWVARGTKMQEHQIAEAQQEEEAFRSYVRGVAGNGGSAGELEKLVQLRDRGAISEREFQEGKERALRVGSGQSQR